MPNHIRSIPASRATGKKIGNVNNSKPIESTKQPKIRYSKVTTSIMVSGPVPKTINQSVIKVGTPLKAINRPNKTVPMTAIKILAVPERVCKTLVLTEFHDKVLLMAASKMANAAPTAPASVGVKKPNNIPSSTEIIKTGNGHTSLSESSFSLVVNFSSIVGASLGFNFTLIIIINENITADNIPGIKPAMKI